MEFYIFNNAKIAFKEQKGNGIPIVFIHGFCEDHHIWEEYLVSFANRHLILMDLPGSGHSDLIPDLTIENMAKAIAALLGNLAIKKCLLIGHSMGGYIGISFAQQFPDFLIGLGLFHSHPFGDTAQKKITRNKGIEFVNKNGTALFVKQLMPKLFPVNFFKNNRFLIDTLIFRASTIPDLVIISYLKAMKDRPDQSEVLKQLTIPVLFIIGEKDEAIPKTFSLKQTLLPDIADIHFLPNIGHMGMFEAQKTTVKIIRNFAKTCQLLQYAPI